MTAEAEAEDMRRTLSHFQGLEVVITPATEEAEQMRRSANALRRPL